MPVTAKLSRLFYERLGEQVANELVEWFNVVDQTYRADLRELNELNFARFDAKLEQRIAEVHAKIDQRIADLRADLSIKIAELEAKMERRFGDMERRFGDMERRFGDMERRLTEHNRWLVGIFVTTVLGFAGLGLGLVGFWLRH